MSEKEKLDRLLTAALMALGWMSAQERAIAKAAHDPCIVNLAGALKAAGAQCDYVDEILRLAPRGAP